MKLSHHSFFVLCIILITPVSRACAQADELARAFSDLSNLVEIQPDTFDKVDPVFKKVLKSNKENVILAMPVVLDAAKNSHLPVRRFAAMALYEITTRPDGQALLSTKMDTFSALLVDPDIPIRRMTGLAIANLRPDPGSPIMPALRSYLSREDATVTIGAGVATLLLKFVPDDASSIDSVVLYMRRADQTSSSRSDLMTAITNVARSHNREIGMEVARYAENAEEKTSVHAIETLQAMGKDVLSQSQPNLSRIAADPSKPASVRAAAAKALSTAP